LSHSRPNYLAGYSNGEYSLSSVLLQARANATWSMSNGFSETFTGTLTDSTSAGATFNLTASTGSVTGSGGVSFTTGDTFTLTASDSYTSTLSGTDSASLYEAGSYANGSFAFASYNSQDSSLRSSTYTEQDVFGLSDANVITARTPPPTGPAAATRAATPAASAPARAAHTTAR
jgi:hypothetical protein